MIAVILVLVFVLMITGLAFAIIMSQKHKKIMKKHKKYPEGHYMGQGIGIGIPLGIPIGLPMGIAMENIGLGISIGVAIGVALGVAIGAGMEKSYRHKIRPLTKEELELKHKAIWFVMGLFTLGIIVFVGIMLYAY